MSADVKFYRAEIRRGIENGYLSPFYYPPMKFLKSIFIGLLVLVLVATIGLYIYLQTTKPVYSGELALAGLQKPVTVHYDEYGVPHIYAQNETDAYFALGYVHAQDRLFQMEMIRRAASGRLSEILGKDLLNVDKLFRALRINQFAEEHAQKFLQTDTAEFQRAALAYQKGINEFIYTGQTPLEFSIIGIPKTEFTPKDIYLAVGFMSFGFAEGLRADPVLEKIKTELGSDYLKDLAVQTPSNAVRIQNFDGEGKIKATDSLIAFFGETLEKIPVPLWQGSNGWAIAGDRTASGMPILANDTHIGFAQPAVWYEAHIEYPGYKFYGHHIAGIPFGLLGQNHFAGWGLTMFENDDTDFFYEETNDSNQIKYKGEWVDLKWRKETIKVKDDVDVELTIPVTPHGSMISGIIDNTENLKPASLWWLLNHEPNYALQAAYQLNHSQNFADVEKAASLFSVPGLNLMYADAHGNIAWWAVAKLPVRPNHVVSKFFLDGASGNDEYLGFYDFSKNPHSVNPPWGYVYSANNQPDSVEGVLYPGYYYPRSRAGRIDELIKENKKWTVDDVKTTILDVTSHMHADIAHQFAEILKAINKPEYAELQTQLQTWNGDHTMELTAPSIYYNLLSQTMHLAMADEISYQAFEAIAATSVLKNSYEQFIANANSPWWDVKGTEAKETRAQIVEQAAAKTLSLLTSAGGKNPGDWQWRKIHTLTHKHAFDAVKPLRNFFNVGPFEVPGGSEVINNLHFALDTTGYFSVDGGPALRKITDFADAENGISVSPSGQSGNVMSAHYKDQAEMFATGKFRKMLMNKSEIESGKRKLILKPKG
ncbi:MAG TPA: penicillin acylase family protein [Cyclobacteriaceae bacterium]|nr:penicillin acylase family protein [Cyclobacteriaceae bacterium]